MHSRIIHKLHVALILLHFEGPFYVRAAVGIIWSSIEHLQAAAAKSPVIIAPLVGLLTDLRGKCFGPSQSLPHRGNILYR